MLPNPDMENFSWGHVLTDEGRQDPEYLIDEKVRRILYVMEKTSRLGGKQEKREI